MRCGGEGREPNQDKKCANWYSKQIIGIHGIKCMTFLNGWRSGLFISYLHGHSCIFGTDPNSTHNWSPEPGGEDVGSLPTLRLPCWEAAKLHENATCGSSKPWSQRLCVPACANEVRELQGVLAPAIQLVTTFVFLVELSATVKQNNICSL